MGSRIRKRETQNKTVTAEALAYVMGNTRARRIL